MSTCRSCGAPVHFVFSAKSGKRMICDAKTEKRIAFIDVVTGRPYAIMPEQPSPTVRAVVIETTVDHHATCPQAAAWRGKTRASGGAA